MDSDSKLAKLQQAIDQLDETDQQLLRDAITRIEQESNKNTKFLQLAQSHLTHWRLLQASNPTAHKVLWSMMECMNKTNIMSASHEVIASYANCCVATVKKALKYLSEHNWIEITKHGTSRYYAINSRLVWQGKPHGRQTSFNATIILTENDTLLLGKAYKHPLKHIPILARPNTEQTILLKDIEDEQGELDV